MKRFILLGLAVILFTLSHPIYAEEPSEKGGHIGGTGIGACRFLKGANTDCISCFDSGGAWTALGCVGEGGDPSSFITKFLNLGIGVGGGLAFLIILVSGFQTMTSTGNPEKLHAAKELLGGAISGLLLIIFSIFILKIIGVDILGIPTFQ